MTVPVDPEQRIQNLESAVAHLQHDFEQLHQVLLSLQGDLRLIGQTLSKFDRRLALLSESPEERSPEEERPPHY